MTFEQTRDIMTLLQTEYPQSFAKMDSRMMAAKLKLWASEFQADDYRAVYAAVRAIISGGNREFAPNIGVIRDKMRDFTQTEELTEGEAWALVSKALSNGLYGAQKEFDKLPPSVQKSVGSPNQLREWAVMPAEEVQSVVASNFQRSYRQIKQRERELATLPPSVQKLIGELGSRMTLEAHNGD